MKHFFKHFSDTKTTTLGEVLSQRAINNVFNIIKKYFQKDTKLLEIGPGKGRFAQLCIDSKVNYYGIEPNFKMAENLEKLGAKVQRRYVPPIKFKDNTFDIVFYSDVFEHMDSQEKAMDLIRESIRVLKKNGILCILSPEYPNWRQDFFNCDFTHNNPTSLRRTKQIYQNFGLTELESNVTSGPFLGCIALVTSYIASKVSPILFQILSFGFLKKDKAYKLKLMFLRRFIIIGEK